MNDRTPLMDSGSYRDSEEVEAAALVEQLESSSGAPACVFVARYDLKRGATLDYVHPKHMEKQIQGTEQQVFISGLHTVSNDIITFKNNGLYGIAAFHAYHHAT
ncbi:protein of unknown function DUF2347, partial [Kipferlia bialata]|eukprot:g13038.t1